MPLDIREINDKVQSESLFVAELKSEIGKVIVGQEEMMDRLFVALLADGHLVEPAAPWRSLETDVDRQRTRELVRATIDRLPDSYRTVLMLRDLEGLDTRDTAKALGISETNVKVRLHRARQALRGLLDPELREQTP